jgi:RNA-binding protein
MLKGYQKMFLRKIANEFNPAVIIGQHGLTDSVLKAIEEALFVNEVIKIKFSDFKEKNIKKEILEEIIEKLNCENAGIIGHTAILYKQREDDSKISLPQH